MSCALPLAGIIALSSYFATETTIERHSANHGLPIFIGHGTHDPVVPQRLGRHANEVLGILGYRTTFRTYPMEHSVCLSEINDISTWLQETLLND